MTPSASAEALDRYLHESGGLEALSLADLMSAVIRFYTDRRASGLVENPDSDMLLFQYGCFDWGDGETFELDLTRQFIVANEAGEDSISQLHVTAVYEPDAELRALGSDHRWCANPDEGSEFRNLVLNSAALALAAKRRRTRTRIEWEAV